MKVLAVHAHPDDESIWTGGALTRFARQGAQVTVLTCTGGEEGEIIGREEIVADLAGFRQAELDKALAVLQVRGLNLSFRDSGMAGSAASQHPGALVNNVSAAASAIENHLRAEQPDLVITYGPDGGYGHPDHIAAHEATHQALSRVHADGIDPELWWTVLYRRAVVEGQQQFVLPEGWQWPSQEYLFNGTDEFADIGLVLDDDESTAKREAMAAHATQVWIADGRTSRVNPQAVQTEYDDTLVGVYALSNLYAYPISRTEHYQVPFGLGEHARAQEIQFSNSTNAAE